MILVLITAALAAPCDGLEPAACAEAGVARILAGDPGGMLQVEAACATGNPLACYRLGAALMDAPGVPSDPSRAASVFERACTDGQPEACADLGLMHVAGQGVPADPVTARRWVERGCDLGHLRACGELGAMLAGGYGGPKDTERGRSLAVKACEGTLHGPTCGRAAALLDDGVGGPADQSAALRLLALACAGGDGASCTVVATREQALGRAVAAREHAALGCGVAEAGSCALLAVMELRGRGGPADPRAAVRHFVAACDGGRARACQAAGALLAEGEIVPGDLARADELLKQACALDPGACR